MPLLNFRTEAQGACPATLLHLLKNIRLGALTLYPTFRETHLMPKPIIRVYLKMMAQKGRQKGMLGNTERK
jgi:hypothetical protein